jgi:diguanylate cyclase (GGDEF)-like protein
MKNNRFSLFLHKQIPVLIVLSLFPGLGYLLLGWLNGIFLPAFVWYLLLIAQSMWGHQLYRQYDPAHMSETHRERWYRQLSWFFYSFFLLWVVIFLIYVREAAYHLHYIAIFTELGAAVVASAQLYPDRRLYRPIILMLMLPLVIYFLLIGEWYSYVLSVFAAVFTWVLLYSAKSSHQLLMQTSHQANHDALTALHNRNYFIEFLQERLATLHENRHHSFLLLIDLDHFKTINDSLGHDIGDQLLQQVGRRLRENLSPECMVARLGGDEFILIGPLFPDEERCSARALAVAQRVLDRLKDSYIVERHHLYISASIGISLISDRDSNATRFIKEADIAMYEVKAKGRDGIFLFDDEMSQRVETHLEIERLLHFALENEEITLDFQPQLDQAGRIIGAESLMRWNSPQLGSISPEQFIPIAEQTGLIIELGAFMLEQGFKTLHEWHDAAIELEQFSINISMRQFTHQNFVPLVERLAERYLDAALCCKVVFEITESIVAEDINRVIAIMQRFKSLGIRFSMDDFGTGYSSLSYLTRLPIDELKIDRSFVAALGHAEGDKSMVTTILNLAKLFNLKIVAEGVELAEQQQFLLHHNCHYFQGFFYSEPLNSTQFVEFYRSRH